MTQTVIAYALTAAAAGWVAWAMLLPKALRQRIKGRLGRRPAVVGGDKGGCDCGGGGCHD